MTGFKSFADKTVIEFDKGMTAVVGPNGSGKSNLSEAIRWVLGEQSAKSLRGNRMEDVIFNGTQERKPVNIAKVTLVLNNEDRYLDYDYSEISISRSYNRNGDSEYLINNESVRLKDIVDLLLDSGLGKNSFSIISQGQVEQIFLNKPEERRVIFEEAAGVQKYQYRKNEAARKLARSSDNLSRVKDIIYEIEQQLKPLSKQRETALIYQEKKSILKELEISLYTYQIKEYQQDYHKNNADLEKIEKALEQLEADLSKYNQELHGAKNRQTDLTKELDQTTDAYQSSIQNIEQLKSSYKMKEQERQFSESQLQDQEAQLTKQQAEIETEQTSLSEAKETLAARQKAQDTLNGEIEILLASKERLEASQSFSQEEWQANLIDWHQKKANYSNQINQLTQTIEDDQRKINRLTSALDADRESVDQLEADYNDKASLLEEINQQYDEKSAIIQQLETSLNQADQRRNQLKQQLFNAERSFQQLQNKRQYLQQAQANYEGYYGGVRSVMQQAERIGGITGPVADVIQVPQQFQTAIDTALGGSAQHIIVDDDQAAKRAIHHLRQNRAGRATMLPRTNIKPRQLQGNLYQTVSGMPGFIRLANELVQTDPANQAIIDNLLGMTVVAETIDQAQQMARTTGHRVRIVTLDGEILMPGGAITGGRQRNQQQSLLKRQQELEQIEQQVQESGQAFKQLEAQWHHLDQDDQQSRQQLESVRQELMAVDAKRQEQRLVQQTAYNEWQTAKKQIIINESESKETKQELTQNKSDLEKAENNFTQADKTIERINQEMKTASSSQAERATEIQNLSDQLADLRRDQAVGEAELKQSRMEVKRLEESVSQLQLTISEIAETIMQIKNSIEKSNYEMTVIQTELDGITSDQSVSPELVDSLRREREELNQSIGDLENKVDGLSKELQQAYRKQSQYESQNEKFQAFIDNQLEYLNQEYQMSYEAAAEHARELENTEQTKKTVNTLRREIDQLGPVNLQAIPDFEELNERYELLVEQQDDLLTAMAQLEETMAQMDHEVETRFGASFKLINEQFQKTFTHLFMGGSAYLELTDPDDLLTTGVDIIAQPPGKKKQNLALLSGGERALTAIALLFAILEVKPVPFVILDEVEAALDDANVYRYGEYVQNFTLDTQFIVITHRKGTMENADVLYGVTMERTGVSKLASVQLSEAVEAIGEG